MTSIDVRDDAPAHILTSADDLVAASLVPAGQVDAIRRVAAAYAVAITPEIAELIDRRDPADPIARQFVPTTAELDILPGELADPIGDDAHSPLRGLIHRYPDRVLLTPLYACPVYCRFCFRRERVGPGGGALSPTELDAALSYIREHEEIFEVIVSGGDPLAMAPRRVAALVAQLSAIPHLGVIRFHTRVPVVAPRRIDDRLIAALDTDKGLFVALHANHPREFSADARQAIRLLSRAGIALVGQTVLLRGVNDDAVTLEALFRQMVALRIKPYYLHHPDLAPGTAHFRTTISTGRELIRGLRGRVSGLCQPSYVLDLPGGHGKVSLAAPAVEPAAVPGEWNVTDFRGCVHRYDDGSEV